MTVFERHWRAPKWVTSNTRTLDGSRKNSRVVVSTPLNEICGNPSGPVSSHRRRLARRATRIKTLVVLLHDDLRCSPERSVDAERSWAGVLRKKEAVGQTGAVSSIGNWVSSHPLARSTRLSRRKSQPTDQQQRNATFALARGNL